MCAQVYSGRDGRKDKKRKKKKERKKKYVRRFSYAKSRILYIVIVEIVFEKEREYSFGIYFSPFFLVS